MLDASNLGFGGELPKPATLKASSLSQSQSVGEDKLENQKPQAKAGSEAPMDDDEL